MFTAAHLNIYLVLKARQHEHDTPSFLFWSLFSYVCYSAFALISYLFIYLSPRLAIMTPKMLNRIILRIRLTHPNHYHPAMGGRVMQIQPSQRAMEILVLTASVWSQHRYENFMFIYFIPPIIQGRVNMRFFFFGQVFVNLQLA